jgi:hypothetical protein
MLTILSERGLPWCVLAPFDGCDGDAHLGHSVWDFNGNLVCECFGEDEGRREAIAIVATVNRTGPAVCVFCGLPATCFGAYEDGLGPGFACDVCCGHGHCERLERFSS